MAVQMPLQRWLAAASDTRAQKMDVSQAKKLVGAKVGARGFPAGKRCSIA